MRHHDVSGIVLDKAAATTQRAYKWVPVYEFYDLVSETVYHFVEGVEVPVYQAPAAIPATQQSLLLHGVQR